MSQPLGQFLKNAPDGTWVEYLGFRWRLDVVVDDYGFSRREMVCGPATLIRVAPLGRHSYRLSFIWHGWTGSTPEDCIKQLAQLEQNINECRRT